MRSVAVAAVLMAFSTAALSADLGGPRYRSSLKDEPVYAQPFSWTGLYVGGQVGYVWGDANHSFSNGAPSDNSEPDGWVGGGHVGYNIQSGRIVFGIEADLEGAMYRVRS